MLFIKKVLALMIAHKLRFPEQSEGQIRRNQAPECCVIYGEGTKGNGQTTEFFNRLPTKFGGS
jgi:hypothetical protein